MIMADVFKILFLILGMLVCTVSYWLLFASLFPRAVVRAQQAILHHPYRIFMTGALAGVPITLAGLAMSTQGAGPLKLFGVVVLMSVVLAALFGSTGLIRLVGTGLDERGEAAGNGRLALRGGAVVSIACVFPFVGWFMVIPIVLVTGFGAAMQFAWSRKPALGATVSDPEGAVRV